MNQEVYFVQISDENLHHIREIMDGIYGPENFVGQISFQKTGGLVSQALIKTCDYLLWYCKNNQKMYANKIYQFRQTGEKSLDRYDMLDRLKLNQGDSQNLKWNQEKFL